jgi:hypothetical protein
LWACNADPEAPFGIAALDCKTDHGTVRPPAKPVLNPQYEWLVIFTMKPDFAKGRGLQKNQYLQKLRTLSIHFGYMLIGKISCTRLFTSTAWT